MVSMSFNIGDGHISYGQTHNGIDCNGHFEYEYTFNKVLDSVQTPYYKVQHKGGNPSIYIVVRNLRAYKSY
jgi:hypothetical protein